MKEQALRSEPEADKELIKAVKLTVKYLPTQTTARPKLHYFQHNLIVESITRDSSVAKD
jgi:hypothetical protein